MATVNTCRLLRAVIGSDESSSSLPSGPKNDTTSDALPLAATAESALTASSGEAKVRAPFDVDDAGADAREHETNGKSAAQVRAATVSGLSNVLMMLLRSTST